MDPGIRRTTMTYKNTFLLTLVFCFTWVAQALGTPLYLEYMDKSEQDLKAETRQLSREIRSTFDMGSMETAQQKIDAYDYLSHFKKVVLYASKLATYARYKEDLEFARDNELFKGLPEDAATKKAVKTRFLDEKYRRMDTDVKNEIDTYRDLILISLDACELLTANDFTGFSDAMVFRAKMQSFLNAGHSYKTYAEKQDRFASAWPKLAARIQQQIRLWEAPPRLAGDALVDPKITRAIMGGEGS